MARRRGQGHVVHGPYHRYRSPKGRRLEWFEVLFPEGCVPDRFELPTVGEYARVRIPESWGKQPPCCGDSHAYCEDPCDSGCVWESICLALIEEET